MASPLFVVCCLLFVSVLSLALFLLWLCVVFSLQLLLSAGVIGVCLSVPRCWMVLAACCLLLVVCCSLFVACCLLFVISRCVPVARCLLIVVSCLWFDVCCSLRVVC